MTNTIQIKGIAYPLLNNDDFSICIYNTCWQALQSEWLRSLSAGSVYSIEWVVIKFISWLNTQSVSNNKKFDVLKDFESYRVNVEKVKPQSTGLVHLKLILKEGLKHSKFQSLHSNYLISLVKTTKASKSVEKEPSSLTSFFSATPWLRNELGEKSYLKLESPTRLVSSFSISIATILNTILEIKKSQIPRPSIQKSDFLDIHYNTRNKKYCSFMLHNHGKLNANGEPDDLKTELLLADFLGAIDKSEFLKVWKMSGLDNKSDINANNEPNNTFTTPHIFCDESWLFPSEFEQRLCAWICAWQMIQPYDIFKLKKNDFIPIRNESGKIVAIQCTYYKSRAQNKYEPPLLDSKLIEAKALISYLDLLPSESSKLFSSKLSKTVNFVKAPYTFCGKLFRIIESPIVRSIIAENLQKRQCSDLFNAALTTLIQKSGETYGQFVTRHKNIGEPTDVGTYRATNGFHIPISLFGLAAIKTSSVHSRSDRYRENDLINENSHTSITEKLHYLTDANKDWVNLNGRVARIVMHDIANYVYKPNITAVIEEAHEMSLRTRVINALDSGISAGEEFKTNSLAQVENPNMLVKNLAIDADDIIVLESSDTVVLMLHYINEAENKYNLLISHSLDFLERTVLPTVEWMERILQSQIRPVYMLEGQKIYDDIKSILPELFTSELRAGVGT